MEEEHRTRQGFEILVQQNWVSLGFPFSTNHQLCSPRAQVEPDMIHETLTDTGKWLELDPGVQRIIAIRT